MLEILYFFDGSMGVIKARGDDSVVLRFVIDYEVLSEI